jgi:hypothetical protein
MAARRGRPATGRRGRRAAAACLVEDGASDFGHAQLVNVSPSIVLTWTNGPKITKSGSTQPLSCENPLRSGAEGTRTPDPLTASTRQPPRCPHDHSARSTPSVLTHVKASCASGTFSALDTNRSTPSTQHDQRASEAQRPHGMAPTVIAARHPSSLRSHADHFSLTMASDWLARSSSRARDRSRSTR